MSESGFKIFFDNLSSVTEEEQYTEKTSGFRLNLYLILSPSTRVAVSETQFPKFKEGSNNACFAELL